MATNLDHPSSQHTSSSRGDLISSRGDLICNWASARVPIELNGNVLYQTSFACLFIMALFSLKPVAEFLSSSIHRTAFLDWLALRILDPVIIQCLSLLIVSYAALHYFKRCHVAWASNRGAILYPLLVLGLLLIVEIILEYFVFKPTFSFNRPGDSLGDPWFTALIRHYVNLDLNGTEASSTPSGFVLRQTLLALALVFFIHQPNFFPSGRQWRLLLLHSTNIFVLLLMAWSRLYVGSHRLFDIAIGIGLGGFLFWIMVFVILSFKVEVRSRISEFALPALTFVFMILLYSQHFVRWALFCASAIILLGALFHRFPGLVSEDRRN